ncbi:hypothetical protein G7Y79_00003g008800 [Physcia stellaris]|nr:hypothetical protein G7Y79_00003g008800 [Physcia stellaris]
MIATPRCRAIYSLEPLLSQSSSGRLQLALLARYPYSTKTIASSTTVSTSRSNSLTSSLTLNPPASTRPPPLELPSRLPEQPAYKYYFSVGKTCANFYKTGFINLYRNFQAAKAIAQRLESTTYEEDVRNGLISRAEWHLVRRQRADALKIPLFALVFICCGEFTPLVAIYVNGAIPKTLWVPKQIEHARKKLEARRREVFRNPPVGLDLDLKRADSEPLSKGELLHLGRSLGLYSSLWDRINLPPFWLIRRRAKKHMDFVELDDFTIHRDGGVENLESVEVQLAAEMRGLDVLGKKESELRSTLSDWMLHRSALAKHGSPARTLYFTRPSAWPYHRTNPAN